MALPDSGRLTFSMLPGEFAVGPPHLFSRYRGITAGVPATGTLRLSDFYRKRRQKFRFWRLWVVDTRSPSASIIIMEMELKAVAGGADSTWPSMPITASLQWLGSPPSPATNAINDQLTSGWRAGAGTGNPTNHWIRVDFGAPTFIAELTLYSHTAAVPSSLPVNFQLHGSDDDVNWVNVKSFYVPPSEPWTGWKVFTI